MFSLKITKNFLPAALALTLITACGGIRKAINKTDDQGNKPRVQTANVNDSEAREIARLKSLYNPWGFARPNLVNDSYGVWRQSGVAFVRPGYDSLQMRMTLLDQATTSVRVQSFIMAGDETGQMFANKLIELASRGVQVQFLLDDTAVIFKGSQNLYYYLTSHGIKVMGYRPVWMQIANNPSVFERIFSGTTFSERFGGALTAAKIENHRFHEKIMVIDAEVPGRGIGMVGGTNIANEYYDIIGEPTGVKWRDQDMIVQGDIAADLARAFDSNVGDAEAINQGATSTGLSGTIEQFLSGARGTFGNSNARGIELRPYAMRQIYDALQQNVLLRWDQANLRMIHHRPLHNEFKAEQRFVDAITNANREVIIVNPYVIPSDAMLSTLINTARRGVRIKILTNSLESGDTPTVQEIGRSFYKSLILETQPSARWPGSVPIAIYEWGGDKVFKNGFSNFHAKYMIVDRQIAFLGSFNLDPRSSVFNSEVLFETDAPLLVAQLIEQQAHDSGPSFANFVTREMAESYLSTGNSWEDMRRQFLKLIKTYW